MNKVAVITGAGSGVGRATAVKLAQSGWTVVLIGRTEATLKATADLTKKPKGCMIAPLRIGDLEGTNQIAPPRPPSRRRPRDRVPVPAATIMAVFMFGAAQRKRLEV